jgi:hypothetical protein
VIANLLAELDLPVSAERLESYRKPGGTDLDVLVNYLWNVELSEALYPCLQAIEVTLRNSIHSAASTRYQTEYWFDLADVLLPAQAAKIQEERDELRRRGKPQTAGRIVAELTFGFWVNLFNRPYERAPHNADNRWAWHDRNLALIDTVFPHAPRRVRNRESMRRRCDAVRDLRNRVFHYEPIWHRPFLDREHADILSMIGWISPRMRSTIGLCDRFTLVHHGGRQAIEERLRHELGAREA